MRLQRVHTSEDGIGYFIIALLLLIGVWGLGYVFDIGRVVATQGELRNYAGLSSLAGLKGFYDSSGASYDDQRIDALGAANDIYTNAIISALEGLGAHPLALRPGANGFVHGDGGRLRLGQWHVQAPANGDPCAGSYPCFRANPTNPNPSQPDENRVNAVQIRAQMTQDRSLSNYIARYFSNEQTDIAAAATATVIPRCLMFAVDGSRSIAGRYYRINQADTADPSYSDSERIFDRASTSAGVLHFSYMFGFNEEVRNGSTIMSASPPETAPGYYRPLGYTGDPTERFGADYVNVGPTFAPASNESYWVDSYINDTNGAILPDEYYRGPEPWTTSLLVMNTLASQMQTYASDRMGMIVFDDQMPDHLCNENRNGQPCPASAPAVRVRYLRLTTNLDFVKQLTNPDLYFQFFRGNGPEVHPNVVEDFGFFPRAGSSTNIELAIKHGAEILAAECPGDAQRILAVVSDGVGTCRKWNNHTRNRPTVWPDPGCSQFSAECYSCFNGAQNYREVFGDLANGTVITDALGDNDVRLVYYVIGQQVRPSHQACINPDWWVWNEQGGTGQAPVPKWLDFNAWRNLCIQYGGPTQYPTTSPYWQCNFTQAVDNYLQSINVPNSYPNPTGWGCNRFVRFHSGVDITNGQNYANLSPSQPLTHSNFSAYRMVMRSDGLFCPVQAVSPTAVSPSAGDQIESCYAEPSSFGTNGAQRCLQNGSIAEVSLSGLSEEQQMLNCIQQLFASSPFKLVAEST